MNTSYHIQITYYTFKHVYLKRMYLSTAHSEFHTYKCIPTYTTFPLMSATCEDNTHLCRLAHTQAHTHMYVHTGARFVWSLVLGFLDDNWITKVKMKLNCHKGTKHYRIQQYREYTISSIHPQGTVNISLTSTCSLVRVSVLSALWGQRISDFVCDADVAQFYSPMHATFTC